MRQDGPLGERLGHGDLLCPSAASHMPVAHLLAWHAACARQRCASWGRARISRARISGQGYLASSHLATASRSAAASAHSTRALAVFLVQVSRNSLALASDTACFCLAISAFIESLEAAAPAFLNSRSTR